MPQSLSQLLVHIVFSTSGRVPNLTPELREELYPYMATVIQNQGSGCLQIGGQADHMHILVDLNRTCSLSDLVLVAKKNSSRWLKERWPFLHRFAWQAGYAGFSVSPSERDRIVDYIQDQEAHHRKRSFQDELKDLLHEHAVHFDERYLWD